MRPAERQPCQNKQQECKPRWIWKQGWGKCARNAREPPKNAGSLLDPAGSLLDPAQPPCGWGSKGQNQNFPKIFQKPAEGTSKEAACPMARRIWAKWSNGACLRIRLILGGLCQVCVIFLPFGPPSANHFRIATASANQGGFIPKGAATPPRLTNSRPGLEAVRFPQPAANKKSTL